MKAIIMKIIGAVAFGKGLAQIAPCAIKATPASALPTTKLPTAILRWGPQILALMIIGAATVLTSCNVTRTITTTSSSVKRGDTTIIIQSKTIESYDATKRL